MTITTKLYLAIAAALIIGSFFVLNNNPFMGAAMRWLSVLAIAMAFVMRD
jgi:hypothetical protein